MIPGRAGGCRPCRNTKTRCLSVLLAQVRKNSGNVTGGALDAQVALECFPRERFGFSLRYNYNGVDLDFERARFDGNLHLDHRGRPLPGLFRFRTAALSGIHRQRSVKRCALRHIAVQEAAGTADILARFHPPVPRDRVGTH